MSAHPHPAHQHMYTYPSMQQHHQDTYIMQMQQQHAAYMQHMQQQQQKQQQQQQQQQQIQQQQHQQLNAEDGAGGNGAAHYQYAVPVGYFPPWVQPGAVQGGAVQGGAQPQAWPQQQQQYNPNAPRQDGAQQGQLHPGAYGGFPLPYPYPVGYYNPGYPYAAMGGGMNPGSSQGGRPENAKVGLNPSTSSSTSATSTSANSYPSTQGAPASVNGNNNFSRNEPLRPINQIAGLNGEQGIREQGILCLAALCERKGQNDLRNSNATASLASVGLGGPGELNKITREELIQEKKRAMENTMHLDHQILNQQQMLELQAVANLANKG
ncbi:hypothetical protein TrVE_jg9732 [Triparma verrucosa]|uniref:Uncharacterized protein n=1 Tax=Triparma verrucosa TaxID=1606542 RepID=A0A9W7CC38_9STRA|nr:hypothetical protein TrVE_jg9732 [Triparma verrucosa]